MIVRFDSLDRFEVSKFYVCNPGCVYNAGVLSNTLGCLPDTTDEELILNFNTTSELNFRVNRVGRNDPDEHAYALRLYKSIQNRRLIFVEDVGFFVITEVTDGFDAGIHYKDVRAESCEYEISNKALPYIEDGTYLFTDLLEKIVSTLPLWKIGEVNGDVAKKYRTFEDVGVDKNALSFLLEDMQDAYECIFIMDTIKREIDVYDQNYYVNQTNIHLTKDDLINSVEIKENSDDLYTAINVQGDDNLNISPINPLGTNVIYRFDYYIDWMTHGLATKVRAWQALVNSKLDEYYVQNLQYYKQLTNQSSSNSALEMLNTQLEMYQRMRNNIVAEGSTVVVESYNEIIKKNNGVPVGVQDKIADTLLEIDRLIANVKDKIEDEKSILKSCSEYIDKAKASIKKIHDEVNMVDYVDDNGERVRGYFTDDEYAELSNYIYEGSYTDEYITVTESMTYTERFEQMKTLYDRAVSRLERISEPTQEFDIDVENFLFVKEFSEWSESLETGCLINVELDAGDIAALFLSNITVNYDDKTLKLTFGNRFNRFDPKAIFNNVLGDIKKSTNSINYIKEILYPVKNGEFDVMKEAIESSQILTKNMALTSADQEILIDDTGILCRRYLENGEYDPKQIKVTNQTIVFTEDGWSTSSTAIGNFAFNSPFTGEPENHYGVIADRLIGTMVLAENMAVYNNDSSITLGNDGFTLTSDYTDQTNPSRKTFLIRKRIADEDGNEDYINQLYIDDKGNLVLNGTLSVFTSSKETINLEDISGVSMSDVESTIRNEANSIYEALDDRYADIVGNTTNQINSAVSAESNSLRLSIEDRYDQVIAQMEQRLSDHDDKVARYLQFDASGLTIGSINGAFKTLIDDQGIFFKQNDTTISYVANNQLRIPSAVIESTLYLGNFFFSPHGSDGGFSITWRTKE